LNSQQALTQRAIIAKDRGLAAPDDATTIDHRGMVGDGARKTDGTRLWKRRTW